MTRPASNGSIIGATQDPTPTSAGGIWTLPAQLELQKQGKWIAPGYNISRSLRFDSARSNYLSRTPGSAGNRKTWTWSGWVKRGKSGDFMTLFSAAADTSNLTILRFKDDNKIEVRNAISGVTQFQLVTTQVFRDFSSFYHIILAVDTDNGTAGDRVRLYVNGVEVTAFDTDTQPSSGNLTFVNNTQAHNIGRDSGNPSNYYYDGYLAEVHFVDGQALDPSYFGIVDNLTGVWRPKQVEDMTYGTNGFYLPFSDNTSTTTLGYDQSGNSNNWTLSANFSVAAGANNDSLVDVPTRYGTDTGAGGEVRGNYCTLNAIDKSTAGGVLSNGNLNYKANRASWDMVRGTIGMSTGKWYWEVTFVSGSYAITGIAQNNVTLEGNYFNSGECYGYNAGNGYKYGGTVGSSSYGATWISPGDVCGVAFDADARTITFYKNGVSQGVAFSSMPTSGAFFPAHSTSDVSEVAFNLGQRPFAHTAPSGFKALCTTNLPEPTVVQGDDYFNTVLYTGNGGSLSVTGVGFQPDFNWIKSRSNGGTNHLLEDVLRGTKKSLLSNSTSAELTRGISSFDSDGFSFNDDAGADGNFSGHTYVAWNWKANGAGSLNEVGTISSTVSVNTTAGISIVTYTGTGANATVGHGLGVAPKVIIIKRRDSTSNWHVAFNDAGISWNWATDYLLLNTTGSKQNNAPGNTFREAATSTVFSLGTNGDLNASNGTYVALCFREVEGFSKFGSYTGNGSTDGPFVYTGFRPAFVLIKSSSIATNWYLLDSSRTPFNEAKQYLYPNLSDADNTDTYGVDFLSNGFKVRGPVGYGTNNSGGTYIYMAFAENPFKNSLAR